MTKQERARVPKTLLVMWCAFCEEPDYAHKVGTEIENDTCPMCDHKQDVLRVRVEKS